MVVANPDGAGLLPALGLNSMFVGTNAGTVKVRPDLLDHPEQFALSRTGQPGDGGQLNAIVALRDQTVVNGNQQTLEQYLSGILGDVGAQVSDTDSRKSAYTALGKQLDQQVQGESGVDPNEELVKLVQYQHAFQMSAKYVSTVNQTLDALFQIL